MDRINKLYGMCTTYKKEILKVVKSLYIPTSGISEFQGLPILTTLGIVNLVLAIIMGMGK